MKFLLIVAFVAVATASPTRLIVPGPAGPAPVVDDSGSPVIADENESPISIGPAIVDENESPISVGPAIVDDNESPISVGPAIVDENDYSPISIGPAIVDQVGVEPSSGSPLVQIIINVKSGAAIAESPVAVEDPEPGPVIVDENPEEIAEQPIANPPIIPSPVVVLPEELN